MGLEREATERAVATPIEALFWQWEESQDFLFFFFFLFPQIKGAGGVDLSALVVGGVFWLTRRNVTDEILSVLCFMNINCSCLGPFVQGLLQKPWNPVQVAPAGLPNAYL